MIEHMQLVRNTAICHNMQSMNANTIINGCKSKLLRGKNLNKKRTSEINNLRSLDVSELTFIENLGKRFKIQSC